MKKWIFINTQMDIGVIVTADSVAEATTKLGSYFVLYIDEWEIAEVKLEIE